MVVVMMIMVNQLQSICQGGGDDHDDGDGNGDGDDDCGDGNDDGGGQNNYNQSAQQGVEVETQ